MWTPQQCHSELTIHTLLLTLNLLTCFSERIITMVHVMGVHVHTCIDFKPCSEALEMRRRKLVRRRNYSAQLKNIATRQARRKRFHQHHRNSKSSLNQIAKKLQKDVRKMDRRDLRLWDGYLCYYQDELHDTIKKMWEANHSVDLLNARIGQTKKFSYWLTAVKMFINRVRDSLNWYEKWVHPNEVKRQLKTYLTLMTKYQTTTSAHWIQLQVKGQLEEVLERMFWDWEL